CPSNRCSIGWAGLSDEKAMVAHPTISISLSVPALAVASASSNLLRSRAGFAIPLLSLNSSLLGTSLRDGTSSPGGRNALSDPLYRRVPDRADSAREGARTAGSHFL